MKKLVTGIVLVIMACLVAPSNTLAGKKAQTGDRDGTPDRERLEDGSCQDLTPQNSNLLIMAGKKARTGDRDGTPDRDRRRDGSCLKG